MANRAQLAWDSYARDAHPALSVLAREAARRGLSVRSFATRARRDVKVVIRWFQSKNPRKKTVERICIVLGIPAVGARALLDVMTPEDERAIERHFLDLLEARSHSAIHPELTETCRRLRNAFYSSPVGQKREALRAFILAETGLDEPDSLALVERLLSISVCPRDPKEAQRRRYEAYAAFLWLAKIITFSRQSRTEILPILEPYFLEYPVLRELLLEQTLTPEAESEIEEIAPALTQARELFVETLFPTRQFSPGLEFRIEPIGSNKGTES